MMNSHIKRPSGSLSREWKFRLELAVNSFLAFRQSRDGKAITTQGSNKNGRFLSEISEEEGAFTRCSIQLALSKVDDLGMLELGWLTVEFFRALFPNWRGVERWIQLSAINVVGGPAPIDVMLDNIRVSAHYHAFPDVIEFRISVL